MKRSWIFLMVALIVMMGLVGCGPAPSPGPGSGTKVSVTEDINALTTWTSGKIYIIENTIGVYSTLVIQAGVIVKFKSGTELNVYSDGVINASAGTSSKPIIFTSYKDDSSGGDTNGNGSANQPVKGDWDCLSLNGTSGSTFNNCKFYYGGNTYNMFCFYSDSQATITNCTFAHSYSAGLDAQAGLAGTIITGCTFFDNDYPLLINTNYDLDNSNIFRNPANTSQKNTHQGIFVAEDIDTARSWGETELAYVCDGLEVWDGITLTLGAGVVLKFTQDTELDIDSGASINGFAGAWFTSYKDDAHGGDSNGDGVASSPGATDWYGICQCIGDWAWVAGANILHYTNYLI